jgi:hypothetical protein
MPADLVSSRNRSALRGRSRWSDGHMSWTESILLAVICSVLSRVSYQKDFLSTSSGHLIFSGAGFARQALRYLAGRLGLARWQVR